MTNTTTYRIDTAHGDEVACGMTQPQAMKRARELANAQQLTFYVAEDVDGSQSVAVAPAAGTLHILGHDDSCGHSDCSPGCQARTHQVRVVSLRITHGDDREPIEGTAHLRRDLINGGWTPMGDSIDCWLSQEIVDHGNATGTLQQIIQECRDSRIHAVRLEAHQ